MKKKKEPTPISAGYTAEEIKTQFFNSNVILEKPRQIFRLQHEGNRYYYSFDQEGEPRFYISITSLCDKQAPKPPHLIKWIAERGIESAEEYRDKRAEYGTFLHIQCGELLLNKKYDLEQLAFRLEEYLKANHLPISWIREFSSELKKDVLSFAQFLKDYDVEPIAIEMPLASDLYGCASTIDIVCRMNAANYVKTPIEDRKKVWAIIDIKSGKKGFNESHEVQLFMGKIAFEENFPETAKIERMYNWAPCDWWKAPSYKLKDQTEAKGQRKLEYYLHLQAIDEDGSEKYITVTGGNIDLSQDLTNNYKSQPYTEIVKAKRPKINKPKSPRIKKKKGEASEDQQAPEIKIAKPKRGRIAKEIKPDQDEKIK